MKQHLIILILSIFSFTMQVIVNIWIIGELNPPNLIMFYFITAIATTSFALILQLNQTLKSLGGVK